MKEKAKEVSLIVERLDFIMQLYYYALVGADIYVFLLAEETGAVCTKGGSNENHNKTNYNNGGTSGNLYRKSVS